MTDPKKAGFGPPPRLRTRTGDIGIKTKLDRLLSVANGYVDGEDQRPPSTKTAKPRVTRGEFDCPICNKNYRARTDFEAHERACRLLSKGQSRASSSRVVDPDDDPLLPRRRDRDRNNPFDCDDEDALNTLLEKTSLYASKLRSDRQAGRDVDDDSAERRPPPHNPLTPDFFAFLDGGGAAAGGFGAAFGKNLHGAARTSSYAYDDDATAFATGTGRSTPSTHFDKIYEESRRRKEEKENGEAEAEAEAEEKRRKRTEKGAALTGMMGRRAEPPFDFVQHERLWSKFENLVKAKLERREQLTYADVPFPPLDSAGTADLFGNSRITDAERRTKLRTLLLRWHPDKFKAKHAPLFAEADFSNVMNTVTATSQKINEAKKFENDIGG